MGSRSRQFPAPTPPRTLVDAPRATCSPADWPCALGECGRPRRGLATGGSPRGAGKGQAQRPAAAGLTPPPRDRRRWEGRASTGNFLRRPLPPPSRASPILPATYRRHPGPRVPSHPSHRGWGGGALSQNGAVRPSPCAVSASPENPRPSRAPPQAKGVRIRSLRPSGPAPGTWDSGISGCHFARCPGVLESVRRGSAQSVDTRACATPS